MRYDTKQLGIAAISRTSGEAIPTKNTSEKLYPKKAWKEAMELTHGMSYSNQKGFTLEGKKPEKKKKEVPVYIDEKAYKTIIRKYADKKGSFSYDLLNKDLIKFANSSSKVKDLLAEGKSSKAVAKYVVEHKFRTISKNPDLTGKEINTMVELLDELSPKGVLKELNDYLRQKASANKKK